MLGRRSRIARLCQDEPRLKDPRAFWYNFAQINGSVRISPALACGLEQRLWDIGDIVKLIEEWEAQA